MNGITEGTYFREYMACRLHDRDVQKTAREEGRLEGEKAGKLDDAKNMLADGLSIQAIAKYTGLTLSEIQSLN